jgi:hypothetical protein
MGIEGRSTAPLYAIQSCYKLEASASEVIMQFEVKGQNYFLEFLPEEGEWLLLRPSREGLERMAIADDSELPFGNNFVPFDTDSETTVN